MFKRHFGNFGRRVLKKELSKKGIDISQYKISKILKENNLRSKYGRKKCKNVYTSENTEKFISDNIFANLTQKERSKLEIWRIDFSEIKLRDKKYYLCGIVSVNSKICISLTISNKQTKEMAYETIKKGIEIYGKPNILMSDRGCQFTSKLIHDYLETEEIVHSMSRPHKPIDNRYIETFWKTLKTELGKIEQYEKETFEKILEYYQHYYNYERPHSTLNYLPPIR